MVRGLACNRPWVCSLGCLYRVRCCCFPCIRGTCCHVGCGQLPGVTLLAPLTCVPTLCPSLHGSPCLPLHHSCKTSCSTPDGAPSGSSLPACLLSPPHLRAAWLCPHLQTSRGASGGARVARRQTRRTRTASCIRRSTNQGTRCRWVPAGPELRVDPIMGCPWGALPTCFAHLFKLQLIPAAVALQSTCHPPFVLFGPASCVG